MMKPFVVMLTLLPVLAACSMPAEVVEAERGTWICGGGVNHPRPTPSRRSTRTDINRPTT